MVDVQGMWKILERDYGIRSMDEFKTALQNCKGINIGVLTEGGRINDTEGVPGEDQCRASA